MLYLIKIMKPYIEKSAKERRIDNINNRIEATQTINPITGEPYLDYNSPKVKRLEDPIQAHFRMMEERNPSSNEHKQGFLKDIACRLSLVDRALQYWTDFHIFKTNPRDNNKKPLYDNIYKLIDESKLEDSIKKIYSEKNLINYYKKYK